MLRPRNTLSLNKFVVIACLLPTTSHWREVSDIFLAWFDESLPDVTKPFEGLRKVRGINYKAVGWTKVRGQKHGQHRPSHGWSSDFSAAFHDALPTFRPSICMSRDYRLAQLLNDEHTTQTTLAGIPATSRYYLILQHGVLRLGS